MDFFWLPFKIHRKKFHFACFDTLSFTIFDPTPQNNTYHSGKDFLPQRQISVSDASPSRRPLFYSLCVLQSRRQRGCEELCPSGMEPH